MFVCSIVGSVLATAFVATLVLAALASSLSDLEPVPAQSAHADRPSEPCRCA